MLLSFIRVGPGLAHLSNVPFSGHHPWGAWRERRQFVGRVSYGAKFELWQPNADIQQRFPPAFREIVNTFLFLKPQDNCPISWMSNDVLFYILNSALSRCIFFTALGPPVHLIRM